MNFCASCLEPAVSTDKPEADGREVTNLVSPDPDRRRLGYAAEYFIRPPVDIKLQFTVPIDVSHVKLWVKLDHKCSSGFIIFTQPENAYINKIQNEEQRPTSVSEFGAYSGNNHSSSGCSYMNGISVNSQNINIDDSNSCENGDDGSVYYRVGSYFTKNEDCLVLKNPYYKHWINMKMPVDDINSNLTVYNGTLKHNNRWALRCVRKMIIRISRMSGSPHPVLKAVEIWGQPGISTKKDMRKNIISKWLGRAHEETSSPLIPRIYNSEPEEKKLDSSEGTVKESKDAFEIPEDFLDPLTCDVMTIPLLLPSGHSVDAYSLERFIANEAIWGRPASDPFTGIPFKPGQKPSPNVSLKARIDRFLLMNADHPQVWSCGRTLGASGSASVSIYLEQNVTHSSKRKPCNAKEVEGVAKRKHSISESDNKEKKINIDKFTDKRITGASKPVNSYADRQSELIGSENHDPTNGRFPSNIKKNISQTSKPKIAVAEASKLGFSQANKSAQSSINSQKPSHTHHGLIHMIGSALSRTQQRTDGVKSSSRNSLGKPSSLIHGEANNYNKLEDIIITNSASCVCGTNSDLYRVPCNHVICRKCLLNEQRASEVRCRVCGKEGKKAEVVKFHEKSMFS